MTEYVLFPLFLYTVWTHVLWSKDVSGATVMYFDGVQDASRMYGGGQWCAGSSSAFGTLTIGNDADSVLAYGEFPNDPTQAAPMDIAELRFHHTFVSSAAQALEYRRGVFPNSDASFAARYDFCESVGDAQNSRLGDYGAFYESIEVSRTPLCFLMLSPVYTVPELTDLPCSCLTAPPPTYRLAPLSLDGRQPPTRLRMLVLMDSYLTARAWDTPRWTW